jgi:hypothetical protein
VVVLKVTATSGTPKQGTEVPSAEVMAPVRTAGYWVVSISITATYDGDVWPLTKIDQPIVVLPACQFGSVVGSVARPT